MIGCGEGRGWASAISADTDTRVTPETDPDDLQLKDETSTLRPLTVSKDQTHRDTEGETALHKHTGRTGALRVHNNSYTLHVVQGNQARMQKCETAVNTELNMALYTQ